MYFRSPILHGIPPVAPSYPIPAARRLFFLSADGLRADTFFEYAKANPQSFFAGLLREWPSGVIHAHVPTESRPGHVALTAGFYEDVSAVTRGWKVNPVHFDTVFNESKETWGWGSPDVLDMFRLPHVHMDTYPADWEDFGRHRELSRLDRWVFQRAEEFFARAEHDADLLTRVSAPGVVFFLHLLTTDVSGHAHRPDSEQYRISALDDLDAGVARLVARAFALFGDDSAFVFTSDHGMGARGSHGDGHPDNTRCPLLAWGAGVDHSQVAVDAQQADVAPLMAALVARPLPANSVGRLPKEVLADDLKGPAVKANAEQLRRHVRAAESAVQARVRLFWRPYRRRAARGLDVDVEVDMDDAEFVEYAHEALRYYHTYDRHLLALLVFWGYLSFIALALLWWDCARGVAVASGLAWLPGLLGGVALFSQGSPLEFYLYLAFPAAFSALFAAYGGFSALWALLRRDWAQWALALAVLEALVCAFFARSLLSVALLLVAAREGRQGRLLCALTGAALAAFPLLDPDAGARPLLWAFGALASLFTVWYGAPLSLKSRYGAWGFGAMFLLPLGVAAANGSAVRAFLGAGGGVPVACRACSWALLLWALLLPRVRRWARGEALFAAWGALQPVYLLLGIGFEPLFSCALFWALWARSRANSDSFASSMAIARARRVPPLREAAHEGLMFLLWSFTAFFGTGNVASISSFDVQSTYPFVTVFWPEVMAALIVVKVAMPLYLVVVALRLAVESPAIAVLAAALADVMTANFFLLVRDEGSWREIGVSISHFAISNFFILSTLLLMLLSRLHLRIGAVQDAAKFNKII